MMGHCASSIIIPITTNIANNEATYSLLALFFTASNPELRFIAATGLSPARIEI
jgi:hypothetical protein